MHRLGREASGYGTALPAALLSLCLSEGRTQSVGQRRIPCRLAHRCGVFIENVVAKVFTASVFLTFTLF